MGWQGVFRSLEVYFYQPWFSTHLLMLYDCTALWTAINFFVTCNIAGERGSGTVVCVIRTLVHGYIQLCSHSSTLLWFLSGIAVLILKGISFFRAPEDLATVISQDLFSLLPHNFILTCHSWNNWHCTISDWQDAVLKAGGIKSSANLDKKLHEEESCWAKHCLK